MTASLYSGRRGPMTTGKPKPPRALMPVASRSIGTSARRDVRTGIAAPVGPRRWISARMRSCRSSAPARIASRVPVEPSVPAHHGACSPSVARRPLRPCTPPERARPPPHTPQHMPDAPGLKGRCPRGRGPMVCDEPAIPDFDTGEIHTRASSRSNNGWWHFGIEGVYVGDQVRCTIAGGCLRSKRCKWFAASGEGSVTCHTSP
jgi:hypothetical protein